MLLCYRNPRLLTGKCLRDLENNIKMKGRWHKSSGSSPHGHQRSGLTHPSLAKAKTAAGDFFRNTPSQQRQSLFTLWPELDLQNQPAHSFIPTQAVTER